MQKFVLVLLFFCTSLIADEKSQYLRKVHIEITSSYTNQKVDAQVFIDKQRIVDGQLVKPGSYQLQIQYIDYTTIHKDITILASNEPFLIQETLIAKPRQISFEPIPINSFTCFVDAHEILDGNTGQKVEFRDEFKPGKEQCFIVKFKKYETQVLKTVIPPGEGPYVLEVPLLELSQLEFTIRKNSVELDSVEYQYEFRFDDKPVEKHHMKMEKGIGRFYYTVMMPENAKSFQAYIGYKFLERSIKRFRPGMSLSRPENLSVSKLIEHLDIVAKRDLGRLGSLEVMERFLKGFRHREMLKKLDDTQKDLFVSYLKSWEFSNEENRMRLQKVITEICLLFER